MSDAIVNRVAGSGLVSIDLEEFYPAGEFASFDMKDHLYMGLILKEKDFREAMKSLDWSVYRGKNVAVGCSVDAVIPVWAYMLVAVYLQPVALEIYEGTAEEMKKHLLLRRIEALDPASFLDARVVVKGCGDLNIGSHAYTAITRKLLPVVKSIMYGEPCSTVPVYKKK